MQTNRTVDVAKGLLRQPDVTGIVLHQENLCGPLFFLGGRHWFVPLLVGGKCGAGDLRGLRFSQDASTMLRVAFPTHQLCICCGSLTIVSQKSLMLFTRSSKASN